MQTSANSRNPLKALVLDEIRARGLTKRQAQREIGLRSRLLEQWFRRSGARLSPATRLKVAAWLGIKADEAATLEGTPQLLMVPCANCGIMKRMKPSQAKRSAHHFCNRACRRQWYEHQQVTVQCAACGRTNRIIPSLVKSGRHFCNRACEDRGSTEWSRFVLDNSLKERVVAEAQARGIGIRVVEIEAGLASSVLFHWLRSPKSRLWPKTLEKVAVWLGITVEEAIALQGGQHKFAFHAWWRNPHKAAERVEARRKMSAKLRGRTFEMTDRHKKAISVAAKGKKHRVTTATLVKNICKLVLARSPHLTRLELEERVVAILMRSCGMTQKGAKGLVRSVMSKKQSGRHRRSGDWEEKAHLDRLAGKKVDEIALELGKTPHAVEVGLQKWVASGRYLRGGRRGARRQRYAPKP